MSEQNNTAIKGLLKAYRLIEKTKPKDEMHLELIEVQQHLCEIFGWDYKTIKSEGFRENITLIYQLTGV